MQHIDISPRKASRAVKPGPSDRCGDLHFSKMMIMLMMGIGIMMKIVRDLKKNFLIHRQQSVLKLKPAEKKLVCGITCLRLSYETVLPRNSLRISPLNRSCWL